MNKRVVIGLNMDNFLPALISMAISLVALFIPYVSAAGGNKNMIGTVIDVLAAENASKLSVFLYLALIATIASLIMAVVQFRLPLQIWE